MLAANRDIAEGEEITDNYLPDILEGEIRDKRRAWLHHFYRSGSFASSTCVFRFLCECPVCVQQEQRDEEAEMMKKLSTGNVEIVDSV